MAKINVIDKPDVPFFFGKINRRPLVPRQAKRLATGLESSGIRCFVPEHMLPVIVPTADCVELEGLIKDVTAMQNVSILKLKENSVAKLVFASGQHRVAAAKLLGEKFQKRIAEITNSIKKIGSENTEKMTTLEEALAAEKVKLEDVKYWGVTVYNESKQNINIYYYYYY
jgi:hypothetical protein